MQQSPGDDATNNVPPGFADIKEKGTPESYNDYIVWKQLIDLASQEKKDILFVTDDSKNDWWWIEGSRTIGPRPELLSEFGSLSDRRIWIYKSDSFLHAATLYMSASFPEQVIQEVRARAHNHPHAIAWSLFALAEIHGFLRHPAEADEVAAEVVDIAQHHCFPQWLALGLRRRGWALCLLGDTTQGLALLEEGLRRQHATGQMTYSTGAYCDLAEGCLLAGAPGAALSHIEAAHRHTNTYGEHYMRAEIHRLHAEVLQIGGAPAPEIEGHLREALNIARDQGARLWELRAGTSLARLWHTQGRATEAYGLLAPIYTLFTEGFDLPDLIEARALLSGASRIPKADP